MGHTSPVHGELLRALGVQIRHFDCEGAVCHAEPVRLVISFSFRNSGPECFKKSIGIDLLSESAYLFSFHDLLRSYNQTTARRRLAYFWLHNRRVPRMPSSATTNLRGWLLTKNGTSPPPTPYLHHHRRAHCKNFSSPPHSSSSRRSPAPRPQPSSPYPTSTVSSNSTPPSSPCTTPTSFTSSAASNMFNSAQSREQTGSDNPH